MTSEPDWHTNPWDHFTEDGKAIMPPGSPPDVPRCHELPIGAPCPQPDDCICQMVYDEGVRLEQMWRRVLLAIWVIISLAIATVFLILAIKVARGADVDPQCLTKSQARAKFKTQHLYWHTADHCWDNRSGRGAPPSPPPPVPRQAAPRPVQENVSRETLIAYPTLMAGLGTDAVMLKPGAMTSWPLLDEPREFTPWQERIDLPALGGKPD